MTRRQFIPLAGVAATAGYASLKLQKPPKLPDGPPGNSAVAIVRARSYSEDLVSRMLEGVRQCGLDVRGKRVLLKPNLVEFDSSTVINTDASVIAAAVELFHRLGAAEVQDRRRARDIGATRSIWRTTRAIARTIPKFESIFTDLNRDDVSPVKGFADEAGVLLPEHGAGRRSDRFARQDEDASLGRRDALDEELLRPGAGLGLRMAEEQAALHRDSANRWWS